jgi:hypothetical protein
MIWQEFANHYLISPASYTAGVTRYEDEEGRSGSGLALAGIGAPPRQQPDRRRDGYGHDVRHGAGGACQLVGAALIGARMIRAAVTRPLSVPNLATIPIPPSTKRSKDACGLEPIRKKCGANFKIGPNYTFVFQFPRRKIRINEEAECLCVGVPLFDSISDLIPDPCRPLQPAALDQGHRRAALAAGRNWVGVVCGHRQLCYQGAD